MTNYEKNKELLDMYAVANVSWGVDADGKVFNCSNLCSVGCIFSGNGCCKQSRLNWLKEEYKEPEVDWSKVEIDTPISVRDNEDEEWKERYFAGYLKGKILAFADKTSSKSYASIYPWNYAKLAEQEDD